MNKITLLGNMVKDPEMRSTTNGKQVASFSIAVSRRFKREKLTSSIALFGKNYQKP